jgi:hypothetical protein
MVIPKNFSDDQAAVNSLPRNSALTSEKNPFRKSYFKKPEEEGKLQYSKAYHYSHLT